MKGQRRLDKKNRFHINLGHESTEQLPGVECQKKWKGIVSRDVPFLISIFLGMLLPSYNSTYFFLPHCVCVCMLHLSLHIQQLSLPLSFVLDSLQTVKWFLVDSSLRINLIFLLICQTGSRLNEYILHYETLDYDTRVVSVQHNRHRRAAGVDIGADYVHVEFHSHGKPFRLKLKRDTSSFSSDVQIVSHQGQPLDVDTSHLYEGHLQGNFHIHFFPFLSLQLELEVEVLLNLQRYTVCFYGE